VLEGKIWGARRWAVLLLLGLLLHLGAMANSDLGLDAHVRLNAANGASSTEQELAWGSLRVTSNTLQTPDSPAFYDGYIPPWSTSEAAMKWTSLLALVAVAGLATIVPKWQDGQKSVDFLWPALILLSPAFLFATGRGYDEPIVALLIGLGTAGFYLNKGDEPHQLRLHLLLLATSLLLVMGWKGFSTFSSFGIWALVLILGAVWIELERRQRMMALGAWLSHPWKMGGAVALFTYVGVFVFSLGFGTGTFSVVLDEPGTFLLASLFALLDSAGVYLLIGMMFWPFISASWRRYLHLRGPGITLLVMFISGLLTALIAYIAALWSLESKLWGMSLFETMFMLGNNGRYATCLVLPLILLINWERPSSEGEPFPKTSFLLAFCILLPAIFFTAFVGQQLWSVDAAESLQEAMVGDESSLLFVGPEALSMHHLYVVKTHVDLDGALNLNGYWRAPGDAEIFLDEVEVKPDFVLVAPNTNMLLDEREWTLVAEEPAPRTVTGWSDKGVWQIYRHLG